MLNTTKADAAMLIETHNKRFGDNPKNMGWTASQSISRASSGSTALLTRKGNAHVTLEQRINVSAIETTIQEGKVILIATYFPPNLGDTRETAKTLQEVLIKYRGRRIILGGNFNEIDTGTR